MTTHAPIDYQRMRLIEQVERRFGVTMHPHPRRSGVVVVSESDYARIFDEAARDPRLDVMGRCYYLVLGPQLTVQVAPDWACDPVKVALLRLRVAALDIPLRPIVRGLNRLLTPRRTA
ncbi:hypothetical protein [Agrococcus casei]|uniref:hypothetical protein n=1 Tax=Agrococcus casei TaxID=343512 RepID=UPI003F8F6A27